MPGAPLTLRASVRELAAMFGVTRPTIRASVVLRREPAGYLASVSMASDMGARTTCEAADTPGGIDEILECIALSAIGFIDPKLAASYVFSTEQRNCGNLDMAVPPEITGIAREERRIKNRRERCSFEKTQAVIARILERGRAEAPWAPDVYGRIHLARAAAVAGIDCAQQLAELDQAIGRFGELLSHMPDSPTALAVLIDAYGRRGVSIDELTTGMQWTDDRRSPLQFQLYLAELTFAEAARKLNAIPLRRGEVLDARVRRLQGQLIYRQWMLLAHRRTHPAKSPWRSVRLSWRCWPMPRSATPRRPPRGRPRPRSTPSGATCCAPAVTSPSPSRNTSGWPTSIRSTDRRA